MSRPTTTGPCPRDMYFALRSMEQFMALEDGVCLRSRMRHAERLRGDAARPWIEGRHPVQKRINQLAAAGWPEPYPYTEPWLTPVCFSGVPPILFKRPTP